MILALLLACVDPKPADPATADSADTADPEDPAAACPTGSHLDGETCVSALTAWTEAPALDAARDHHLTLIEPVGDHAAVLVMAGTNARGRVNPKVERAWLEADGSLSAFEALDSFEGAAIGQGLGRGASGSVLVGGLDDSGNSVADTFVLHVSEDGDPSFTAGPPLVETRYHATATAVGGFVYVIGGLNQVYTAGEVSQEVLATVERAPFDGETLGAFETIGSLPDPSTHHAVWTWGTGLYLAGGGDGARARDTVLRAELNADGSLGDWIQVGTLPEGRATSAATVLADQVFLVAGMAKLTGEERDTALRADLSADGSVGEFEALTPLPTARAHAHQAPIWQGWMVSAGGSIDHVVQDQVYVGALE